ncbi:MAG TPA: amidohydrolase family protein, partial [Acidimicrobiia bacterium]|nr:amidohydrolase family protein [Acidimicrobiia bacterium]
ILLPNIPPDVQWVAPLYDPVYDPLWTLCEELEVPVNSHGGTGSPDYGRSPTGALLQIAETPFYSQRPFVQFVLGGVFERHPNLKFVMTEMGASWIPAVLAQLDGIITRIRDSGEIGELKYEGARADAHGDRVLPPELLGGREPAGARRRRGPQDHGRRPVHVG